MRRERAAVDELAQGLARGTISRRRALTLGGAVVVGGLLGGLRRPGEAQAGGRCRPCSESPSCAPSGCGSVPPGSDATHCSCVEDVGGRKCCVAAPQQSFCGKACNRNSECGKRQICSTTAVCFCLPFNPGKKGVCIRKCKAPLSGSTETKSGGDEDRKGAR